MQGHPTGRGPHKEYSEKVEAATKGIYKFTKGLLQIDISTCTFLNKYKFNHSSKCVHILRNAIFFLDIHYR